MDDDDLIPISALQHFLYCPRQCALIHVERLWHENRQTAEGRLLHENAHDPGSERRKGVRVVTAMPLLHAELGLVGVADVVEFHAHPQADRPVPVEYKRGRPKGHRADEVQLCAQALCLEFMLETTVPEGFLYYGKTRRRQRVPLDPELRAITHQVVLGTRRLLSSGQTPLATYEPKRCDPCSLIQLCQPRWLAKGHDVNSWLRHSLDD